MTCGSYHTAAVSGNGDLFTWGGGMYGKLGHGNELGHSTPKRVEALAGLPVSQIACGSRHTVAVVSNGALYSWGDKEVRMILITIDIKESDQMVCSLFARLKI